MKSLQAKQTTKKTVCLLQKIESSPGAIQQLDLFFQGVFPPEGIPTGSKAYQLLSSSDKFKNEWSYISIPPHALKPPDVQLFY